MQEQLYIPKKIKVGYQKRSDTYTKRLAYVIYYDSKGKLRKETSWEGWRDKEIPFDDFDNEPHSGFILNKDVQRSSEWRGSGRNLIRIYDDRGIEFEISCENLMFILMNTNCNKRGLDGEFVYAWDGKDLVLLPVGSPDYKQSMGFSDLQGQKVGARNLILGATYEMKDQSKHVYLGRYLHYEEKPQFKGKTKSEYYGHDDWRNTHDYIRTSKKKYVFQEIGKGEKGEDRLSYHSGLTKLARCIEESPVSDIASRIEGLKKVFCLNKVVGLELVPFQLAPASWPTPQYFLTYGSYDGRTRSYAVDLGQGRYEFRKLTEKNKVVRNVGVRDAYESAGFKETVQCIMSVDAGGDFRQSPIAYQQARYNYGYYGSRNEPAETLLTEEQVKEMKVGELFLVLESGEKIAAQYNRYW